MSPRPTLLINVAMQDLMALVTKSKRNINALFCMFDKILLSEF